MALFGNKTSKKSFTIPDMHCGHCEMRVKTALETIDGVEDVKPDFKKQTVRFRVADPESFDEKTARAELEAIGYPPAE
jgi:copper chaperone CopZ